MDDLFEEAEAALSTLVGRRGAFPGRPVGGDRGAGRGAAAGARRAADGVGQERGLLRRHCAAPRAGAGPTLIVSPLLELDAQPDRRGRARRDPDRAHHERQPRRVGTRHRRAANATSSTCCWSRRNASPTPPFRRDVLPLRDRTRRAARHRRGALHQRLGPRLPARLPAHRARDRSAARGHARAVHDRDRERPRRPRHRRPARRRSARAARFARSGEPRPRPAAPAARRRSAWRGSRNGCRSCPARASSTRSTIADARRVAEWLRSHGIAARAYSGDESTDDRIEIERAAAGERDQVRRRDLRARHGLRQARPLVRRALPGAGFRDRALPADRPRRAGRSTSAYAIGLAGDEDARIQNWFIDTAFPSREHVDEVMELLGGDALGEAGRARREP